MAAQPQYPNTRGFAYSLANFEFRLGRKLFTTFKVTHSQAIEEGWIWGSGPEPLLRTRGQLQPGEGTLETEDLEEAQALIDHLASLNGGDGFSDVTFPILARYTSQGRPAIERELIGCRVLDVDEDSGDDGQSGVQTSFPISFSYRTFNGKKPLKNQRT